MSSLSDFYVPIEFKNLKLCCDLNNFKFIDWNENENVIININKDTHDNLNRVKNLINNYKQTFIL